MKLYFMNTNLAETTASEPMQNYDTGYISIYRSIRKHWIWDDPVKLKWWLTILLEVNHCDRKVLVGEDVLICKRGQSVNSQLTWSKMFRCSRSKVRRFLYLLENDSMIVLKTTSKTTILTVCNYDCYQKTRTANEQQMNIKRTSSEHQVNTNNNDNNYNKDIGDKSPPQKTTFKTWTKDQFFEKVKECGDGYDRDIKNQFFKYWIEPSASGKMRFQLEKTWETSLRLSRWANNEEKWLK